MINSKLWRERWMGGGASHARTHTHTHTVYIYEYESLVFQLFIFAAHHTHICTLAWFFWKIDFCCGRKATTNGWREGGLAELRKHTHTHTHTHTHLLYLLFRSELCLSLYFFREEQKGKRKRRITQRVIIICLICTFICALLPDLTGQILPVIRTIFYITFSQLYCSTMLLS